MRRKLKRAAQVPRQEEATQLGAVAVEAVGQQRAAPAVAAVVAR